MQGAETHTGLTVGALVIVSLAIRVHAQCQYEVTIIQAGPDCGVLPPSPTRGRGINEDTQVVGGYTVCGLGPGEAFLWDGGPDVITLERPPGVDGAGAWDVNDAGMIAGQMIVDGVGDRAFLHDGTGFTDLGTLPGGNLSRGRAINSRGQIVGVWGNNVVGDPALAAFLWQDGVMIDIHADLGTPNSEAEDINDQGQVTGWMGMSPVNGAQAFVWQEGQVTGLGHLPDGSYSVGHSINEFGEVAGSELIGQFPGIATRAFRWSDGEIIDLELLPGFERSSAAGINDLGQVVGVAWGVGGNLNIQTAFIWQHGIMTDLNALIPPDEDISMRVASAINNAGQITGWATSGGAGVAVLLTPINEPPGDLDHDCTVGSNDFDMLLAAWGPCPAGGGCPGDLDGDGFVGIIDLLMLLANWT